MNRRTFVITAAGLLAAPLAAWAQPAGKVFEVGLLTLSTFGPKGVSRSFIDAMRELNYVEGRNPVPRRASAEFKLDRLPGLAADLVQARMDVIVTTSTPETLAAKRATSTIPIVMIVVPDPVEQGLVASLARPGGNVTGLTSMVPGFSQKSSSLST